MRPFVKINAPINLDDTEARHARVALAKEAGRDALHGPEVGPPSEKLALRDKSEIVRLIRDKSRYIYCVKQGPAA